MRNLSLLTWLFFVAVLVHAPRLWAFEKNEFQVISESVHFYKGQVKTIDNLPQDVEVERFVATRMEAAKKTFILVILSWDSVTGLSYWISAPYQKNREPEPDDLNGKQFDVVSYLADENIYISKIGIASWNLSGSPYLFVRGFSDRFKTLNDARNAALSRLSEMPTAQVGESIHTSIMIAKYMPDAFFIDTKHFLPCGMCKSRAKLTSVRVAGDKWLISISGGYQTDAELVLDKSYTIVKVCIHPAKDTKNEKPN